MAFPISNYARVWVRGKLVDLARAARESTNYGVTGPIQFIPTPDVLIDSGTKQIIDPTPLVVYPSATDGSFAIQLPSTDDPDINPSGWNYKVIEPTGREPYFITVPYNTSPIDSSGDPLDGQPVIELSSVVPDPEANAGSIQVITGAAGRGIESMEINGSQHLIITYTDSTTEDAGATAGSGDLIIRVAAPTGTAATDTAAIQTALDAANTAGGGWVQLDRGTYIIQAPETASSGGVRIRNNTVLAGHGMGVTTLKVANSTSTNITGIVRTPSGTQNSKVTVRDLTIDGNKANKSGTPVIIGFYTGVTPQNTNTDTDILVQNVECMNCTDYGFDPHERCTRIRFLNCTSHDNDMDGFTLDGCYDFEVIGCIAYSNGRHGFNFVTGTARGTVSGCVSRSNTSSGFTAQNGAKNITFTGNVASGNTTTGFFANGAPQTSPELDTLPGGGHIYIGNTSLGNGTHGLQLNGASYCTVNGNHFQDNSQTTTNTSDHIRVSTSGSTNGTNNVITGNSWQATSGVTNQPRYGINENSSSDGPNLVIGNQGDGHVNGTAVRLQHTTSLITAAHNGTQNSHPATNPYIFDSPSKHGYKEWNYDPAMTSSGTGTAGNSGYLYLLKLTAQEGGTISNIHVVVGTAGGSLTSGQNFAAIYNSSGTRIGVTSDQASAWGSTGHKTMSLTASASLTAGQDYYIGLLSVGSTPAAFLRGPTGQAGPNANLTGAALRFSINGTGLTATPSSVTLASNVATQSGNGAQPFWVALS